MNTLNLLLDQSAKAACILLAAWALSALAARRSASRARLIWASAFLALLALPLTLLVPASWEYGATEEALAETMFDAEPEENVVRIVEAAPAIGKTSPIEKAPAPVARSWQWPTPAQFVLYTWGAGAALLIFRRCFAGFQLARLRRGLHPIRDVRLLTTAREILGRHVSLLRLSEATDVRLAWGVWNPVIVLPADATEWTEPRLRAALLHEWAHVRAHDCLLRLLSTIACALHWPNPLVWLSARALRTAQEQTCDDFALSGGADAEQYAQQLVATARIIRDCPAGAFAMAQPSTLSTRIRAVCDPRRDRRGSGWLSRCSAMLVTFALLAAATLAAPGGKKPASPKIQVQRDAQIEISAKFIELSAADVRALFPKMRKPGLLDVVSNEEAKALVERIGKIGGKNPEEKKDPNHLTGSPSGGADLLSVPRVTTKSGNRAVIEVIREVRYEDKPGVFEIENTGATVEVLPRVASDSALIDLTCKLTELKPAADGKKITRDSFHRIKWHDPQLRLAHGQSIVIGGWDTIRKDRQLVIFVQARSWCAEFVALAETTELPALKFTDSPLTEVAEKLAPFVRRAMSKKAARAEKAGAENTAAKDKLSVTYQASAGLPEPRVTLQLPAGSLANALRRVAQNANVSVSAVDTYVDGQFGVGRYVFALPPPSSVSDRAARILLKRVEIKGQALKEAINVIQWKGGEADVFAFSAPISFDTLPAAIQNKPVTIEAENVTLRDALRLAATAAGAELSVDSKTFHIHLTGERPKGAKPVAGSPQATARAAKEGEIAGTVAAPDVSIEVHFAELTEEQLKALPIGKDPTGEGVLKELQDKRSKESVPPGETPGTAIPDNKVSFPSLFAGVTAEVRAHLQAINAAGILVSSPPLVKAPQHKQTTFRARENSRPDGTTECTDITVEPSLGPDGGTIELQFACQYIEKKDGAPSFSTRKITTNIAMHKGTTAVLSQAASAGKVTLIFVTAKLP